MKPGGGNGEGCSVRAGQEIEDLDQELKKLREIVRRNEAKIAQAADHKAKPDRPSRVLIGPRTIITHLIKYPSPALQHILFRGRAITQDRLH